MDDGCLCHGTRIHLALPKASQLLQWRITAMVMGRVWADKLYACGAGISTAVEECEHWESQMNGYEMGPAAIECALQLLVKKEG